MGHELASSRPLVGKVLYTTHGEAAGRRWRVLDASTDYGRLMGVYEGMRLNARARARNLKKRDCLAEPMATNSFEALKRGE